MAADGNMANGLVTLRPNGTPSSSGAVTLNWPLAANAFSICTSQLLAGSASWQLSATVTRAPGETKRRIEINWSNAGVNLAPGQTYTLAYRCDFQ